MMEPLQFLPLALVSSIFCVMTGLMNSPYQDSAFSVPFVTFTCFLGSTFLSSVILIFNAGWTKNGVSEANRESRLSPVGWFAGGLFFFGILFLFISFALHQSAISTLVICPLLFVAILVAIGYLVFLDCTSSPDSGGV